MMDGFSLETTADTLLVADWSITLTPAGAWSGPEDLDPSADWAPAPVPGTAAEALTAAGRFDPKAPEPLHDKDVWYRAKIQPIRPGGHRLRFEGLATICEAWVDGTPVLISNSMYAPRDIALDLQEPAELVLCFRALAPHLEKRGPRARWRTRLATSQGLRLLRTTLFGHMPGWCPEIHAVGPWRPIRLVADDGPHVRDFTIASRLGEDGTGRLEVSLTLPPMDEAPLLACAGWETPLDEEDTPGRYRGEMLLPAIEPWWPHTHGTPHLHDISLRIGDTVVPLGRTGFRRIEVDRGEDGNGFALKVNGVPVFCRGAVWTTANILRLPSGHDDYRPWLERAVAGNMNMLRIGGTMAPEGPAFFELCDALGLMVWQDLPFANFDYPAGDDGFREVVTRETESLLGGISASPSLVVVCGGSEMYQQGAMLGLPESRWRGPLTEEILPAAVTAVRPDVIYVPNSPSGGAMPFSPNAGIAHYYGVGAYRRPLEDARRANVRFTTECLAFANVPEAATVTAHLPGGPGHAPDWKRGVPRDRSVGWDFEDIRDHYVKQLYGIEPLDLRYGDPAAYLDHGRAAIAEVMETTFAEWRRHGSSCHGALVWTLQDLVPGAGWGVIDATGLPKSAWYGLRRAFQPLAVMLTDEGTNGLDIHLVNDGAETRSLRVELTCLGEGVLPVASGALEVDLEGRGTRRLPATDLLGAFFDVTHAFRFGPPSHDCVHVRLVDRQSGETVDEAFHFPLGRAALRRDATITARVEEAEDGGFMLVLSTDRLAPSVSIEDANYLPEDNWFHLAPGAEKRIALAPRPISEDSIDRPAPRGTVTPLGGKPGPYAAG